eukprot:gb/GECG01015444.1/.p1 GENE.gb/GECG01015444.1/~~gb/GECG01015444.1/.p1  ORF type:complete len:735 (+),score=104.43 gb/GECG01015444.1/:1-2205(+)
MSNSSAYSGANSPIAAHSRDLYPREMANTVGDVNNALSPVALPDDQARSSNTTQLLAQFSKHQGYDASSSFSHSPHFAAEKRRNRLRRSNSQRSYYPQKSGNAANHGNTKFSHVSAPDGIRPLRIGTNSVVTEGMLYGEDGRSDSYNNPAGRSPSQSSLDGNASVPVNYQSKRSPHPQGHPKRTMLCKMFSPEMVDLRANEDKQYSSSPLAWKFQNRLSLAQKQSSHDLRTTGSSNQLSTVSFEDVDIHQRHRVSDDAGCTGNSIEAVASRTRTVDSEGSTSREDVQCTGNNSPDLYSPESDGNFEFERNRLDLEDESSGRKRLPEISTRDPQRYRSALDNSKEDLSHGRPKLLISNSRHTDRNKSLLHQQGIRYFASRRSFSGCLNPSTAEDVHESDETGSTELTDACSQKPKASSPGYASEEMNHGSLHCHTVDGAALHDGGSLPSLRVTNNQTSPCATPPKNGARPSKLTPMKSRDKIDTLERDATGDSCQNQEGFGKRKAFFDNERKQWVMGIRGSRIGGSRDHRPSLGSQNSDANRTSLDNDASPDAVNRREYCEGNSVDSSGNTESRSVPSRQSRHHSSTKSASSSTGEDDDDNEEGDQDELDDEGSMSYEAVCDDFGGLLNNDGSVNTEEASREWDSIFRYIVKDIANDLVCFPDKGTGPLHYRRRDDVVDRTRERSDGILRALFDEQRDQLEANEAQQVSAAKRQQRVRIKQMERERMRKKWAGKS